MSEIRVNDIVSESNIGAVGFSKGINISSGVVTATTFIGNVTGNVTGTASGTAGGLSGTPDITVGLVGCSRCSGRWCGYHCRKSDRRWNSNNHQYGNS